MVAFIIAHGFEFFVHTNNLLLLVFLILTFFFTTFILTEAQKKESLFAFLSTSDYHIYLT